MKRGFTLVEMLIIVIILAVLAATIIPQFRATSMDARKSTVEFNLQTMRSQLSLYQSQHGGRPPADLKLLLTKTDVAGNPGRTEAHRFGPYLTEVPRSPLHGNNSVVEGDGSRVVGSGEAWQYNPATGDVWVNKPSYLPGATASN